jgi:putative phosphoesterase
MRVAAIYDIHGNLPALEAVLAEISRENVDLIIVGGDVVPGPMPRQTLQRLLDLKIPTRFIPGNGEVAVLQKMAGKEPRAVPPQHRPVIAWTAELLAGYRQVIADWPATLRIEVPEIGSVLFCHATPRYDNEIVTRLTPEKHLLPIFDELGSAMVICGHTHMQFDRKVGGTRVLNAGSVGMPFGEPGAYWLLLDPAPQLRQTRYDLAHAATIVRNSHYPEAHEFAARHILQPPTEQEMLDIFTPSRSV